MVGSSTSFTRASEPTFALDSILLIDLLGRVLNAIASAFSDLDKLNAFLNS
jgi:hypothetical protein